MFDEKKIYFKDIDERDLVKYLTSNPVAIPNYDLPSEIPTFHDLTLEELQLKEIDEIHPTLSFISINLEEHFKVEGKTKYFIEGRIKQVDKHFEKLLRISIPESSDVQDLETNFSYDSEEEMIIDINKRPKSFLLVGDTCRYLKMVTF